MFFCVQLLDINVFGCFFFAVLDDEDSSNITAGSIVTVTVTLNRKRMAVRNVSVLLNTYVILDVTISY